MSVAIASVLLTAAALNATGMPAADPERIRAHMSFLADDLLEGREAGARGHEIAARYVAAQFVALGLEAAGSDGFFQQVPLRKALLSLDSPTMTLIRGGQETPLEFVEQFVVSPSKVRERSEAQAELVFVGYGIEASEFEHDDYAGLDVRGKIIVMLSGAPLSWPSEERAHFSRSKLESAVARGAVGVISVATPVSEKVFPFARSRLFLHQPRMGWIEEDGSTHRGYPELLASASISMETAALLFEGAPLDADALMKIVEADDIPPTFALEASARVQYDSALSELASPNVIARLPGSDPSLAQEHVALTAHLDHIGFARTVTGDNINNGAMDNASGVATLLEAARLLAAARPARSVLFTIVTAEEKGLLGAEYYATHPTVPIDSIVANVNLDMPMLTYPFAEVVAFGAQHSTVAEHVARVAEGMGIALGSDPFPEQAIFVRSDHYRFVQQGVPAVMLATGHASLDPERSGAEAWSSFLANHYHMPSDDMNQPIDFASAARFARLNAEVAASIASAAERPRWQPGDFFARLYAPDTQERLPAD